MLLIYTHFSYDLWLFLKTLNLGKMFLGLCMASDSLSTHIILITHNRTSAIRHRANLKTDVTRKQSTWNFPKNDYFLPTDTHTQVYVSGGKKRLFLGNFDVL